MGASRAPSSSRDRVASHLAHRSIESSLDRSLLDRLNQIADEKDCAAALLEVYGPEASIYRYVTDPSRLILLDLLPMDGNSRVLEIGCGLGQFTVPLAGRCGHVSALEVVQEQAAFTLRRCREAGLSNVDVAAGGDDCALPYADQTFDGVLLNLVLEWCGMRDQDRPFEESQRHMLREIHRVLIPGGFAFVATKNRFAIHLLLGKRDGHAHELRFGHALPRRLMRFCLWMKGQSRPRGMLHSFSALQHILTECGFDTIQPFWAVPDMRWPTLYIPADAESIRRARRTRRPQEAPGRIQSRIMRCIPARVVPHVAPGLVFLVRRAHDGRSV